MRLRLYAVLPRRIAAAVLPRGLEREPLRIVRFGALGFVVGEAKTILPPVPANLLAHDRLISRIARLSPSILPARFSMVVDDAVRLKVLALDRGVEIQDALDLVAGCEQMTVRFAVSARPRPPAESASGSAYLHTRAAAAKGPDLPEIRALRAGLKELARAERIGADRKAATFTLYHLIERGRARAYRRAVRAFVGAGRVSGPFAPYAFVPESLS